MRAGHDSSHGAGSPRSRRRRFVLSAALLAAALWLAWGAAGILHRAHDASVAADEPYFWRFWTRETLDLRELLAARRALLPERARVLVVAPGSDRGDGFQVALWAQFVAPELDFVWVGDAAAEEHFAHRLRWNLAADQNWRVLAERGRFALEARVNPR